METFYKINNRRLDSLAADFKNSNKNFANEIDEFIKDPNIKKNLLTVKSQIFKITINATSNDGFCHFVTYYDRDNKKILYCSSEH